MPFNVAENFAPVGVPLVEIAPATLVATFRHTFAGAPAGVLHVQPGHDTLAGAPDWIMYSRSVMSAEITCDGLAGGCLVIEIGSDNTGPGVQEPDMHDWIPISLSGGNLPTVITGFELPALVVRFRLITADLFVQIIHGSIIMRAV